MAKFYGSIGYTETIETAPGVWTETIVERNYSGDIIRNYKRWQSGDNLNDELVINNEISILADPFAYQIMQNMRYVTLEGAKWKINKIEINTPRLILTIGGVYNG